METIEVDGLVVRYEGQGVGPPLVLLHRYVGEGQTGLSLGGALHVINVPTLLAPEFNETVRTFLRMPRGQIAGGRRSG